MRDEFDSRVWNAHHEDACATLTRVSDECVRQLGKARQALYGRLRDVGFRGASMVAAVVISGAFVLLTVAPVAGA